MALRKGGMSPEVLTGIQRPAARQKLLGLPQNSQFTYWVDPTRISMSAGVARYNPIAVPVQNGIQGVLDGDPTLIDALQVRNGRIVVPDDFPCVAWGERVAGYRLRTTIGQDRKGKVLYHYHDVWTRHRQVGHRLIVDFDRDGWNQFCLDVVSLVGNEPDEAIADAETARLRSAAHIQRNMHGSAVSDSIAESIEAQITPPAPSTPIVPATPPPIATPTPRRPKAAPSTPAGGGDE